MKKIILFLSIVVIPIIAHSQNWQWAKQVGSNIVQSYDYGYVSTDGSNAYLMGWYSGSLYLQTDTLNANGTNGLFAIKYDANGNELWAKGFGGNASGQNDIQRVNSVYDANCNCHYLAGNFSGEMILGNDTLNSYPDNLALYIARMDLNGNFIWAKSINNTQYHVTGLSGHAEVYCSPNGIVYLTGGMLDTITICGNTILPGGFMVKYDSNGNCLLARNLFSNLVNRIRVNFIANDLILSGNFKDSIFSLDTTTIVNNGVGTSDFYISRSDTNANIKWIKHFGYSNSDAIGSLDVDNNTNEIYFTGNFQDSVTINSNTLYNTGRDIFFAKFDSNGNTIWTKQGSVPNTTAGCSSLKVDNDGNFYAIGSFANTVNFGTYTISTSNTLDMFLVRYNSSGDCLGVRHFGYASGGKVVVDNAGNPICSGAFQNTVNIGSNTFTSNGYFDVYLAKSDIFTGIGGEGRIANNQLIIYANPNAGKCNITVPDDFLHEKKLTLSIYDNTGKLIQQKTVEMNDGKIKLNLEAEATGVYNVALSNGKKSYNGKIVFE
jgi:hypothetical protein